MRQSWDDVKAHIKEYYNSQNKSLEELEQLMISNHAFRKSRRSYMNKIVEWGYQKKQRRRITPNRRVQGRIPPNIHASSSYAATGTISDSNYSAVPLVAPFWTRGESTWPTTGFLGSPLPDTLGHPYDNYQSLQTAVTSPRIGSIAYQSLQAEETAEDTPDVHGQTPLHHAAIEGDLERVKILLSRGSSLHEIDHHGNQPLHYASEKLCIGIVDLLLKNGANVNTRGAEGKTPLHLALRSMKVVNRLLREHPTRIAHDDKGNTVLHASLAAFSGASNSVVFIRTIEKLVRAGYDVNKRNIAGETPFHMLLGANSSTSKVIHQMLILFLENQADVSLPDPSKKMPFQVFLDEWGPYRYRKNYMMDVTQLFLRYGADPNTAFKGAPLLHKVIESLTSRDIDLKFAKGLCEIADVNALADNGNSPLHVIATNCWRQGYSDLASILLRCGAYPNQINKSGDSPLILLSKRASTEVTITVMVSFIKAGANPMQRDRQGDLPVYHAFRVDKRSCPDTWNAKIKVLADSYSAGDMPVERSTMYPNDHSWWIEYRRLRRKEIWSGGEDLRWLAESANYLPEDIGERAARIFLIEAVHEMLEKVKQEFLMDKLLVGLGTIRGLGTLRGWDFQDTIVDVLRECLRLKLDIDQSWYHLTLELFD
ncbi:hypothetical protein MMC15_000571 [Xylographa vitiligo]|nr:hypothetical protein [Xylographa vitiligo]